MKKFFKLFGVIVLVAIIGFSMAACGGDDDDGDGVSVPSQLVGEWYSSDGQYSITIKPDGEINSLRVNAFFFILPSSTLGPTSGNIVFGYQSELIGPSGRFSYSITGNTMTISNSDYYDFPDGTYTRGSGGGTNPGTGGTAPTITTASLPNGTVGTAYNQTLTATGVTPITWSRENGSLPNGLTLSTAGVISGTPNTAGAYTFTVKATNAKGSITKALTITIAAGGGSGSWTAVTNSTFGTSGIKAIAFGGAAGQEKFVAGGSDGKMAYSSDGVTWTAVDTGTIFDYVHSSGQTRKSEVRGIAWGNNKFVAGSSYGKMAYSSDGVTWTAVDLSTIFGTEEINSIAWGGDKFIAGGNRSAYSSDGVTWTRGFIGTSLSLQVGAIAYGSNKFVAGDAYLANGNVVYSSTGSAPWTQVSTKLNGNIDALAWGGNKFVVASGGKTAYSPDGVTWTAGNPIGNEFGIFPYIRAFAWGGNKFVAGGNYGGMAYSPDGITWTKVDVTGIFGNSYSGGINAIAYGNGKFVAGGTDGTNGKIAYLTEN